MEISDRSWFETIFNVSWDSDLADASTLVVRVESLEKSSSQTSSCIFWSQIGM